MIDEAYVPAPFPKETFEPIEWLHVLKSRRECSPRATKLCDLHGYDIVPISMIQPVEPSQRD